MQTPREGDDAPSPPHNDEAAGHAAGRVRLRNTTATSAKKRHATIVLSPSLQMESRDPLIGTVVGGRYRVTGVLGSGGMGRVYAATQDGLGRQVALKVLLLTKSWGANPQHMERFVREAESASALSHPNIVAIYDFGVLEDGRPYLAMERLVGETLADLADRTAPLGIGLVADLMRQAASALDAIHSIGVVHRDVKSDNLVLTRLPDGRPIVKLIDFGLVALAHRHRLTNKGFVVGTPEFVAPEALELDGELPDRRADVYSLAVVTYELLTRSTPFDTASLPELLAAKLRAKPRSLAEAAGQPFAAEVESVLRHGLARKPSERFETAGAFANALSIAAERDVVDRAPTIRMLPSELPRDPDDPAGREASQRHELDNVWSFAGDSLIIETSALTSLSSQHAKTRTSRELWFLLGALAFTAILVAGAIILSR